MPTCCPAPRTREGTDKFFSKHARRHLKRFRRRGLAKEQRLLLEGISRLSLDKKSILEIGCGVGGLHLTMLKNGAASATGIDIAEGMLEGARELAKELYLADRSTYVQGDFVQANGRIGPADITVLDKVVCCYEDISTLMRISLEKTKEIYALSMPRDTLAARMFIRTMIGLARLLRWSFHPYWHDWGGIIRMIEESGFKQTYTNRTLLWSVHVFRSI